MKKLSTTIETEKGERRTIHVYVDDETARLLDEECDERIRHEYIIAEYRSRLVERKETRRHISFDYLSEQGHEFDSKLSDPIAECDKKDKNAAIAEAIEQLTPEQQEVIRLVFYENMTQTEIAAKRGVHKTAVNKQLQRALGQLKKILKNL